VCRLLIFFFPVFCSFTPSLFLSRLPHARRYFCGCKVGRNKLACNGGDHQIAVAEEFAPPAFCFCYEFTSKNASLLVLFWFFPSVSVTGSYTGTCAADAEGTPFAKDFVAAPAPDSIKTRPAMPDIEDADKVSLKSQYCKAPSLHRSIKALLRWAAHAAADDAQVATPHMMS
jgi:hypothetical protein